MKPVFKNNVDSLLYLAYHSWIEKYGIYTDRAPRTRKKSYRAHSKQEHINKFEADPRQLIVHAETRSITDETV